MPEKDEILETYYDHYKDSCELTKEARQRRNKSFIILCVLETVSFLLFKNPDIIIGFLNDAIQGKLETTIRFSNSILQTLVWILVAYSLVRYIQDTLYVEKQYKYLDGLEKKISDLLGPDSFFQREGVFYSNEYPLVLNLIDVFYKTFAPILFSIVNTIRIIQEFFTRNGIIALLIDTVVFFVVCVLTLFYYFHIHQKTTEGIKIRFPMLRRAHEFLRTIFREV